MEKRPNRSIVPAQNGLLSDVLLRIKLIWRLMADPRVSPWLKLIPLGTLVYLVSPLDLIPGAVAPVVGALDDAAIVWMGVSFFIELCPTDVVREHLDNLVSNNAMVDATRTAQQDEIVDGEVTDIK